MKMEERLRGPCSEVREIGSRRRIHKLRDRYTLTNWFKMYVFCRCNETPSLLQTHLYSVTFFFRLRTVIRTYVNSTRNRLALYPVTT